MPHHTDILMNMTIRITLTAVCSIGPFLLLQDLMSDYDEGKSKAAAKEHHHHAKQTPLVLHRKWQVLQKERRKIVTLGKLQDI